MLPLLFPLDMPICIELITLLIYWSNLLTEEITNQNREIYFAWFHCCSGSWPEARGLYLFTVRLKETCTIAVGVRQRNSEHCKWMLGHLKCQRVEVSFPIQVQWLLQRPGTFWQSLQNWAVPAAKCWPWVPILLQGCILVPISILSEAKLHAKKNQLLTPLPPFHLQTVDYSALWGAHGTTSMWSPVGMSEQEIQCFPFLLFARIGFASSSSEHSILFNQCTDLHEIQFKYDGKYKQTWIYNNPFSCFLSVEEWPFANV